MAKKQVYKNGVFIGLTQPVRVIFPPKLAEPAKVADRGDPKYELTIAFPEDHPDYLEMYQACAEVAMEKFGDDVDIDSDIELKFKDGNEEYEYYANKKNEEDRRDYPFLKDMIIMKLRSKNPIMVFDTRRRDDRGVPVAIRDKDEIKDTIYSGCYVSLQLTFATYDAIPDRNNPDAKPGVTAYPEQVCFVNDGERLGGGGKESGQGFAAVQGAVSAEDPTGGEG